MNRGPHVAPAADPWACQGEAAAELEKNGMVIGREGGGPRAVLEAAGMESAPHGGACGEGGAWSAGEAADGTGPPRFDDHIPLARPWLGRAEQEAVREVLESGWISQGPRVAAFEAALARYVGGAHAVATNAATSALHLGLVVAGVRRGDEVICPASTCMATANALCHAGARPVFAEIDPHTFNLDPHSVEALVRPATRAVVVVHQIGQPADLAAFEELCGRKGLLLIEDAATALGARYRGRYVGSHGRPTCFSFHPRKMITTGEGGMLLLGCATAAARARALRATGASISDLVRHQARGVLQQAYHEVGYNYRMTDIQAALGLVQLARLPEMLRARRDQAAYYHELFEGWREVQVPRVAEGAEPCWSSYCVKLLGPAAARRDDVIAMMAAEGISTRRGIPPLYREPCFAARGEAPLPGAEEVARSTLFLPIFPGLERADQRRVAAALHRALRSSHPRLD